MTKLLIATNNKGKLREFEELLQGLPTECLRLSDVNITDDVEETGTTFLENATLKAIVYAQQARLLALADDSGLEVDALNGAPGVYSARYGDPTWTHEERYQYLLQNLKGVPQADRTARFHCVIVISDANGRVLGKSQGTLEGYISDKPKGTYGFGYDPVFFVPDMDKTLAQLTPPQKQNLSHRGVALRRIEPILRKILEENM